MMNMNCQLQWQAQPENWRRSVAQQKAVLFLGSHIGMQAEQLNVHIERWLLKKMTEAELKKIIEETAEAAAKKTVKKLKDADRIRYVFSNSFKKTEELLYLYPNLPEDNPERQRVDQALKRIENDDYKDVIASRYFDGLTITEISEIYDCKYQNISKKRNKLVKILASELFPEDVLKELMER